MSIKVEREQERLSVVFNALGNPIRLRILSIIRESKRPLHIKAVARILQMDYAAVYRHVKVLKEACLVQIFEVGRSRVLSPLNPDVVNTILKQAEQLKQQ